MVAPHEPERDGAVSQSRPHPTCCGWSATQPLSSSGTAIAMPRTKESLRITRVAPIRFARSLALWLCLVLGLLGSGTWAQAQTPAAPAAPLHCVVCAKVISGKYFIHNLTNNICVDCEKLETRCSVCGLPVKENFGKTKDGRFLCKTDLPNTVLTEEEGRRLFDQAASDLDTLSEGLLRLRSPQVNVQMLFHLDFSESRAAGKSTSPLHRLGFSMSRPAGNGFTHNVVLLSGQLRGLTLSTCAHEFGHLWINENRPANRNLEPDTVEAICELLGYKLAARRGDTNELARIRRNPYTNGRILPMLDMEAREGLAAVLSWVRSGSNSSVGSNSVPVATLTAPAQPVELRPPPPPATKLELRSLVRTSKRTFAVISGERFELGTEISLLVGGQRRRVRFESAQENTVVVTVDGEPQTLRLGSPP